MRDGGSIGRALHRYRRDRGFEFLSGLNFFSGFNFITAFKQLLKVVCISALINHILISFSAVQIFGLSYIHFCYIASVFPATTRPFIGQFMVT